MHTYIQTYIFTYTDHLQNFRRLPGWKTVYCTINIMVMHTRDVHLVMLHLSQTLEVGVIIMLNLFHWSINIFQQNPKVHYAFLPPCHISQYLGYGNDCYWIEWLWILQSDFYQEQIPRLLPQWNKCIMY